MSGQFPTNMKTANFADECSLDINKFHDYGSVSNLSFMSNILVKVVLQQLVDYIGHYNLLCTYQSAYRPHHSTDTLLLKTANDILLGLDKGHVSLFTLLVMSSAFDTIYHNILLYRLNCLFGINNPLKPHKYGSSFEDKQTVVYLIEYYVPFFALECIDNMLYIIKLANFEHFYECRMLSDIHLSVSVIYERLYNVNLIKV